MRSPSAPAAGTVAVRAGRGSSPLDLERHQSSPFATRAARGATSAGRDRRPAREVAQSKHRAGQRAPSRAGTTEESPVSCTRRVLDSSGARSSPCSTSRTRTGISGPQLDREALPHGLVQHAPSIQTCHRHTLQSPAVQLAALEAHAQLEVARAAAGRPGRARWSWSGMRAVAAANSRPARRAPWTRAPRPRAGASRAARGSSRCGPR
jgi:hypothetical protein